MAIGLLQGTKGLSEGAVGGLPEGGSTGQVLAKASNQDYDVSWQADVTGAPTDATYVTLTTNATLTNERTLAVTSNLSLSDGGAGSPVVIGTDPFTGDVTTAADSFATTIVSGAVSTGKMADIPAQRIIANSTPVSAQPQATSLSSILDILSSAQGAIIYRGAATWTGLAPGTSGQVLTTSGVSANPSWTTPAASGVTSVAVSGKNGITVAGSPITSAGTIDLGLGAISPTSVTTGVVSATTLNVTGDVQAATGRVTASAATLTGKLTGVAAIFSGLVSADAGIKTTTVSAASIGVTGDINAGAGRITASAATITALLTGAAAVFSGIVSAGAGVNTTTVSAASAVINGDAKINTNSATALVVEQDGVNDNTLVVNTNAAVPTVGMAAQVTISNPADTAAGTALIVEKYTTLAGANRTVFEFHAKVTVSAANGFGGNASFKADTGGGAAAEDVACAAFVYRWAVADNATREGRVEWYSHDAASTGNGRECIRWQANGSAAAIGFLGATAVARQISGANLTNAVTSGGTDDTISNYTDLIVYANDAAAIRNNVYQLSRKVKQVNDAMRLYGLLT